MLLINSGVEQLAARKAHNLEVGGSSPPPAPITDRVIDTIYQLLYRFFYAPKPLF